MPGEGLLLANIIDYVRGADGVLMLSSMNVADALALALAAGVDWTRLDSSGMTIAAAVKVHTRELESVSSNLRALLSAMAVSPRFSELVLIDFERRDEQSPATQFAAVTIWDGQGAYAAYRATDGTLAGWVEDLQLAYAEPVPAQTLAQAYFARMAARFDGGLYAGGHSKGGALALYAGITAGAAQASIGRLYSFDGPGVSRATFESDAYARINDRLLIAVPPESTVGMLLWQGGEECVVKSNARGILQHDAFTWLTDAKGLVCDGELSQYSIRLRAFVRELIDNLPQAALARLVEGLYELAMNSGARTVDELKQYLSDHADELSGGRLRKYVQAAKLALNMLETVRAADGGGTNANAAE